MSATFLTLLDPDHKDAMLHPPDGLYHYSKEDNLLVRVMDDPPKLNHNAPVFRTVVEQVAKEIASPALQDGLLEYYNSQAPMSDANIERRLETEPYSWPYFKFRRPRHNLGPSRR